MAAAPRAPLPAYRRPWGSLDSRGVGYSAGVGQLTGLALLLSLLLLPGLAAAEDREPAAANAVETPDAPPQVDLDSLLKLPDSMHYQVDRRGGATRGEWRQRFETLRVELAGERESLEQSRKELEKAAGAADAWTFTPPGLGDAAAAPVDFQLRQQIRRGEAEVARLERQTLELEVEANLAGVPEQWRQ